MAGILKCWREAATLILVAKSKPRMQNILSTTSKQNQHVPHLDDKDKGSPSDSVENKSPFNYEILTLKRSTTSTFMPNVYVFPGGIADDVDFSAEWLDIYKRSPLQKWIEFVQRGGNGPYMYSRKRSAEYDHIPSELAFRICAIRETFEESGVLLVREADTFSSLKTEFSYNQPISGTFSKLDDSVTDQWREKVDKNPTEFLTMCRELNVVPDVWSLSEWSNWLTPTLMRFSKNKAGRRYDTAFYLSVLDEAPQAKHDTKETVHSQWCPPDELLRSYIASRGGFAPPQIMELARLLNFTEADDLHSFSWERTKQRVDRWFPSPIFCEDGVVVSYPGDDLYPENPDFEGKLPLQQVKETIKEMAQKSDRRNRVEMSFTAPPGHKGHINCNIQPLDGHVKPVTDLEFIGIPDEKL